MPRRQAQDLIRSLGGQVVSSVSKNTDFVLAGQKAGSKLTKAQKLGVAIMSENEFLELVEDSHSQ